MKLTEIRFKLINFLHRQFARAFNFLDVFIWKSDIEIIRIYSVSLLVIRKPSHARDIKRSFHFIKLWSPIKKTFCDKLWRCASMCCLHKFPKKNNIILCYTSYHHSVSAIFHSADHHRRMVTHGSSPAFYPCTFIAHRTCRGTADDFII